mgnify:CR=1 FL=1
MSQCCYCPPPWLTEMLASMIHLESLYAVSNLTALTFTQGRSSFFALVTFNIQGKEKKKEEETDYVSERIWMHGTRRANRRQSQLLIGFKTWLLHAQYFALFNVIWNFNFMLTPVSPSFYFSLDQGLTVTQRAASGVQQRNIRCESLSISQAIVFKIILMRKYRRVLANNIHCWSGILREHG